MIDPQRLAFKVILQAARDAARGDQEARAFFFSRASMWEQERRLWLSVLAGYEVEGTALDGEVIYRIIELDEVMRCGTGREKR